MQSDNGQYRNEIFKRAESMIPQLDGTYNVSDSSDTDLHDYLGQAQILYSIEQEGRNRNMKQIKWHTLIGAQLT